MTTPQEDDILKITRALMQRSQSLDDFYSFYANVVTGKDISKLTAEEKNEANKIARNEINKFNVVKQLPAKHRIISPKLIESITYNSISKVVSMALCYPLTMQKYRNILQFTVEKYERTLYNSLLLQNIEQSKLSAYNNLLMQFIEGGTMSIYGTLPLAIGRTLVTAFLVAARMPVLAAELVGTLVASITYPTDNLCSYQRVQRILQMNTFGSSLGSILKEGGVMQLENGFLVHLFFVTASTAVIRLIGTALAPRFNTKNPVSRFVHGWVTNAFSCCVVYPLIVIRRTMQLRPFIHGLPSGFLPVLKHIYQTGGILGFYNGLLMEVAMTLPQSLVHKLVFTIVDKLFSSKQDQKQPS